jgi:hypothetical protein
MKKFSSSIFIILSLLLLLSSCFIFVQSASADPIHLNNTYPMFPGAPDITTEQGQQLNSLIAWFYYAIISISGFIAFLMIIFGGVQYLASAGNPTAISEAKDRIKSALLGLLIIFASFMIIQTINPTLTILKLPSCGNGSCDGGESCSSCPIDCGACSTP